MVYDENQELAGTDIHLSFAFSGDQLIQTRQRVQRELTGGRGRRDDPLYKARRLLHTGISLLTDRQHARLGTLFAEDDHAAVEVTWSVYPSIIAACRDTDRGAGRKALSRVIVSIKVGVPSGLEEIVQLGRTLHKLRDAVLVLFDLPAPRTILLRSSTADWNTLRHRAGVQDLADYRLRSLLEAGGFGP